MAAWRDAAPGRPRSAAGVAPGPGFGFEEEDDDERCAARATSFAMEGMPSAYVHECVAFKWPVASSSYSLPLMSPYHGAERDVHQDRDQNPGQPAMCIRAFEGPIEIGGHSELLVKEERIINERRGQFVGMMVSEGKDNEFEYDGHG
ncbi:hypothetical protein O1611_g391 [Lasiodiplodia mahajangana]|uniref:Uncharacterized protein n=1 Tax=Lasiodiplodia mahajangana TaxID=1108764 RepID=A0ACC2K0F3_9PEZI|nr:hypothetical protein O1611_g391 [Lasiodiplodia mahajangana]